ncbi:MAG: efflux RND transporter periplasmic adaptor subunit [Candidatus Binatia bacterium]
MSLSTLLMVLAGCRQDQPPPPPPPNVTVSRPIIEKVIEWDEYTGRLEATEQVEVRARVSGYLQSIHFKDGQIVKKGGLLFVIDPRPYQAEVDRVQAELQLAQARLELAKSDYARAKKLIQFRAISQEEAGSPCRSLSRVPLSQLVRIAALSPESRGAAGWLFLSRANL